MYIYVCFYLMKMVCNYVLILDKRFKICIFGFMMDFFDNWFVFVFRNKIDFNERNIILFCMII